MRQIFWLFVVYQFKHFFADYPLQTLYMLGKFKPGKEFIKPLLAHVGVHGYFTFFISFVYLLVTHKTIYFAFGFSFVMAGLDASIHFVMDRIKASPNMLGRYKSLSAKEFGELSVNPYREQALKSNKYFWWALGLDQMVHHLTHYLIIFFLVSV